MGPAASGSQRLLRRADGAPGARSPCGSHGHPAGRSSSQVGRPGGGIDPAGWEGLIMVRFRLEVAGVLYSHPGHGLVATAGQRPKNFFCTQKRPPILGPFDKFSFFFPEEKFSDVGGWVRRSSPG